MGFRGRQYNQRTVVTPEDGRIDLVLGGAMARSMVAYLRSVLPEEGCGVVSGRDGTADLIFWRIPNTHSRPDHYFTFDAEAYVWALSRMERIGHRLLAVVHSHPHGPANLSSQDIGQALWGQNLHHVVVDLSSPESSISETITSWSLDVSGTVRQEGIHINVK